MLLAANASLEATTKLKWPVLAEAISVADTKLGRLWADTPGVLSGSGVSALVTLVTLVTLVALVTCSRNHHAARDASESRVDAEQDPTHTPNPQGQEGLLHGDLVEPALLGTARRKRVWTRGPTRPALLMLTNLGATGLAGVALRHLADLEEGVPAAFGRVLDGRRTGGEVMWINVLAAC